MTESILNPPESTTAVSATSLASSLAASSHSLVEYRGAQTAAVFSNTREELAALLTGAGVYDLGWKSFVRCAGKDRIRWLNGMVTNSVKDLAENAGCYAFVLNVQGRIQGDLDLYRCGGDPEALWLKTDCAQLETLTKFLRRYIIMDQVTLDQDPQWTAVGVAGPQAREALSRLGLLVAELAPGHLVETIWHEHSVVVVATHSPLVPRYEVWIGPSAVLDLWNGLAIGLGNDPANAGAAPCGANAVEQLRILEGTPAYGVDIADRDLPQETNQTRALNFTKGCYLGQEIVERIRSRGNVHRTFSGFLLAGDPPTPKTPIVAQEKPVGELTSAARIDIPGVGEQVLALGFIRREALPPDPAAPLDPEKLEAKQDAPTGKQMQPEQLLVAEGNIATPCALPFDFARTAVQP